MYIVDDRNDTTRWYPFFKYVFSRFKAKLFVFYVHVFMINSGLSKCTKSRKRTSSLKHRYQVIFACINVVFYHKHISMCIINILDVILYSVLEKIHANVNKVAYILLQKASLFIHILTLKKEISFEKRNSDMSIVNMIFYLIINVLTLLCNGSMVIQCNIS